jgi:hypothetical protein
MSPLRGLDVYTPVGVPMIHVMGYRYSTPAGAAAQYRHFI